MFDDLLKGLPVGRVLDVATGPGQFVHALIDELDGYTEIVGVDVDEAAGAAFTKEFASQAAVRFVAADATALPFADESFDVVTTFGSLHHLDEPDKALSEMMRVLRPSGAFVVGEQRRDAQHGSALTHVWFHEWHESVLGIARRTYRKAELLDLLAPLGLRDMRTVVEQWDTSDPHNAEKMARYDGHIDHYLKLAGGTRRMVTRGHQIRARLNDVGINVAAAVFAVGFKA